jgi:hypothetical protein
MLFGLVLLITACGEEDATAEESNGDGGSDEQLSGALATGSSGGAYNVLGGGMLSVINENTENINLNATTPPSVSQTPRSLHDGEAVLGIGMMDMMQRAEEGVGEFDEPLDNLVPVLGMYDNIMSLLVLEDSDVTNVNELEGLIVGVASESTKDATAAFVEASGIDESEIRWEYLPYPEMTEALKDGNIDAGVYTGYPRNSLLEELAGTHGFKFLSIDEDARNAFDEEYPLWASSVIPGGTYPGVDEDFYFFSYFTVLYTNNDVSEQHIYDITKALLENNDDIAQVHPAGEDMTLEKSEEYIERGIIDADKLHPGAKKYFEEQGILD